MTKKVVRTSEEKALLDFQSRPKVMFNQGENRSVGLNPEDDAKLANTIETEEQTKHPFRNKKR